jgi:hypothetical protein
MQAGHDADEDRHLRWLLERLPRRLGNAVLWLRRPSSRWVRIPSGILLVAGSVLSFLPVFGVWMLPLGLLLLGEDFPPLRRFNHRVLSWIERRWQRRRRRTGDQ